VPGCVENPHARRCRRRRLRFDDERLSPHLRRTLAEAGVSFVCVCVARFHYVVLR
jgi:hypothetical protein